MFTHSLEKYLNWKCDFHLNPCYHVYKISKSSIHSLYDQLVYICKPLIKILNDEWVEEAIE